MPHAGTLTVCLWFHHQRLRDATSIFVRFLRWRPPSRHRARCQRLVSGLGHRRVHEVVDGLAELAHDNEEPGEAAQLLGLAGALRSPTDAHVPHITAEARERLGNEKFEEAFARGTRMSLTETLTDLRTLRH